MASLKIEGRLKTPEYVANITRHYRRAIDAAWAGRAGRVRAPRRPGDGAVVLAGVQPRLPRRQQPQGPRPGRPRQEARDLPGPGRVGRRRRGSGSTWPPRSSRATAWSSTATRRPGVPEQGGRVYEVARVDRGGRRPAPVGPEGLSAGPAELGFGRHDLDLRRLRPGQRVWKTDDPELTRRLRADVRGAAASHGRPRRARPGRRRRAAPPRGPDRERAVDAEVVADAPLAAAEHLAGDRGPAPRPARPPRRHDLPSSRTSTAEIEGGPMVPRSLLNALRRDLVARLDAGAARRRPRTDRRRTRSCPPCGRARPAGDAESPSRPPALSVLCRTTAQVEAAVAAGIRTIYADFQDIKRYRRRRRRRPAAAGRGDLPRHAPDPEARRGQPLPLPGQAGGRRPPRPQRGRARLLRRAGHPVRGRLLAERGQRADRRASRGARGACGSRPPTT